MPHPRASSDSESTHHPPHGDVELTDVIGLLRSSAHACLAPLPLGIDAGSLVDTLSRGKLLRARTVLLAAHAYGTTDPEFTVPAAVALELLHAASLVHDDIIDGSELRRGRPALHVSAGMPAAILVGDRLVALAFELAAPLGERATGPLAIAFGRLCEGQLIEAELGWDAEALPGIERYAALKTGALFGAAFQLGAAVPLGDAPGAGLCAAGERLGLAFQLLDDLRDLRSDAAEMGKDHGADLRNGIPTFPLWLALHRVAEHDAAEGRTLRERLAAASERPEVADLTAVRISALVEESRALLPAADRPEALERVFRTVLAGLERFTTETGIETT